MAVEREVLDWGVRLTARPFTGANASLVIKSEIAVYKPGKGSEVRITFPGTSLTSPLRLLDAHSPRSAVCVVSSREKLAEANARLGDARLAVSDILV